MADFTQRLQGLLSGENVLGNFGVGLLANSGPAPVGTTNFGQILAGGAQFATERQRQAAENAFARQQMQARHQQQAAQARISGLLSEAGPEGVDQNALMGLLAQANPQAFSAGLMQQMMGGQERAETSLVRNIRAAGIDPASEEGRGLITANISGGDVSGQLARVQATLAELDVQRRQEELTRIREERQTAQRTKAEDRIDLENSIAGDVSRGLEAAQLLGDLEGTALQTGEISDMRKFGVGLVGLISPEHRELAAKSERFSQIATSFGLRTIELLKGTGTISEQKFRTLLDNSVSGTRSPEANRAALADIFEETINGADKLNIEVPNRDQIEALIPQLRQSGRAPSTAQSGGSQLSEAERAELQRLRTELGLAN